MRKVIINSTPIIALCKVDRLEILHKLYGEVTIPQAVFREVTEKNDVVRLKWSPCQDHVRKFYRERFSTQF